MHGSTFAAGPVVSRAAQVVLRRVSDPDMLAHVGRMGALIRAGIEGLKSRYVRQVRGLGLMIGVEIVEDRDTFRPHLALAERIYYRCLEAGLSFKISAGNVLTLSPPLVISRDDLDRALTIVEDAVLAG